MADLSLDSKKLMRYNPSDVEFTENGKLGYSQDTIFRYTKIERNLLFIFTIEMANVSENSFIFLIDIKMFAVKGDNKEAFTPTMNIIIDSRDYDLVAFAPSEFLVFHEE